MQSARKDKHLRKSEKQMLKEKCGALQKHAKFDLN